MKCAWCQKETQDRYILQKKKTKPNDVSVLPLCREHADQVVGPAALPIKKEGE